MNRVSDETRQDGTRGQTLSWSAVPQSVHVCVQGEGSTGTACHESQFYNVRWHKSRSWQDRMEEQIWARSVIGDKS